VSTLLITAATLLVISFTARAATYTITSYPAGLADLPCDAFKKNADGSWTQVATLVAGGALIPAGSNFKNTAETRIIVSTPEQKCIGWPEQKYISEAGKKARRTGAPWFRHQAWIGYPPGVSELAGRGRR
jgi:hypothetical protein